MHNEDKPGVFDKKWKQQIKQKIKRNANFRRIFFWRVKPRFPMA